MFGGNGKELFNYTKESYGGSFRADLIEQYKLYVQSAENVSARRVSSARYLLTVNAALVASYGFQFATSGHLYWLIPITLVGIVVSLLSHSIIQSHRDLNAIKFKLIQELETKLPAALYSYEWEMAKVGPKGAYRPASGIEMWIPRTMMALHAMAFAATIVFIAFGVPGWLK